MNRMMLCSMVMLGIGSCTPALAENAADAWFTVASRIGSLRNITPAETAALKLSAAGGNGQAMAKLGEAYFIGVGGLAQDAGLASTWMHRAAEAKVPAAETEAAVMDLRVGASGGLASSISAAEGIVGLLGTSGEGLAGCIRQGSTAQIMAVEKLEQDAWNGDAEAHDKLAEMYQTGRGLPRDDLAASAHYSAARALRQSNRGLPH